MLISTMDRFLLRTVHVRAKRRLALSSTIVGLLVLGGCSTSGGLCPLDPPSVTRDAIGNVLLPDGCRLVGLSGNGVQQVSCDDGRSGFAFN